MATDKLPVKWPVRVLMSPCYGLLVLGFNEVGLKLYFLFESSIPNTEQIIFCRSTLKYGM